MNQFCAGREPFPGAGFTYGDDRWDLNDWKTVAAKPSNFVLNFEPLPDWLKPSVKAYLAWGWLAQEYSNSWLMSRLGCLRRLGEYLTRYRQDIRQIAQLDQGAAEGFVLYLEENTSGENAYTQTMQAGDFAKWIRKQYKLANRFRPNAFATRPSKKPTDPLSAEARLIPTEVMEQLLSAVGERHDHLWAKWTENPPSKRPKGSELLYLQVIKILASTPLRISQILLLPRNPLRESAEKEEPGVWVSYQESKTHQGTQEKYVPLELAGMVRESVRVTQEITASKAAESGLDLLFLTDSVGGANGGGTARNVSAEAFTTWLNGRHDLDGNVLRSGFIHRHNIRYHGHYYVFTPHQARHTAATQVYLGGGGFGTAHEHLSHRSMTMTGGYVHGRTRDLEELQKALDSGKVVGKPVAFVQNRQVLMGDISEVDLAYYKSEGLYLQLTPYGFCTRPAQKGPCPHPHPCWRGPKDDPCDSALLLERGVDWIDKDMEVLNAQAEMWEKDFPGSNFVSNVRAARIWHDRLRAHLIGDSLPIMDSAQEGEAAQDKGQTVDKVFPKRKRPGFKPPAGFRLAKQTSIIDGKTASQRVEAVLRGLNQSGDGMTLRQFARAAKVSVSHIREQFSHVPVILRQQRITADKEVLTARLQAEWKKVLESNVAPSVSEFANQCGIYRNLLYWEYPEWVARIHRRREEAKTAKAAEAAEERQADRGVRKQRRQDWIDSLRKRIQGVWDELQLTGNVLTVEDFTKRVGTSEVTMYKVFPEWVDRINEWNKPRRVAQRKALYTATFTATFEAEWAKVQAANEKVSVAEFAERCGIHRNYLYKDFPEWVDRINCQHDYRETIEQALAGLQSSGQRTNMVQFCKQIGINRNVLYKRYPEYLARFKALQERGS